MLREDRIELKDAIADLRRQMVAAAEAAKSEAVQFSVESIDLELTVVAEDSADVNGEIGWWIFKTKAGMAAKDVITHKVKISLKPSNGPIKVGSEISTRK